MSDEDPTVPVVCPQCETTSRVPLSEVGDTIARHNRTQHDGEDVATVDPAIKDYLADLVAQDMGLVD